jgi:hypothetical protein
MLGIGGAAAIAEEDQLAAGHERHRRKGDEPHEGGLEARRGRLGDSDMAGELGAEYGRGAGPHASTAFRSQIVSAANLTAHG